MKCPALVGTRRRTPQGKERERENCALCPIVFYGAYFKERVRVALPFLSRIIYKGFEFHFLVSLLDLQTRIS